MEVELAPGEKLLVSRQPHTLAFASFYVFFAYVLVVGLLFAVYGERLSDLVKSAPVLGGTFLVAPESLWAVALILPALVMAVLRISWRWFVGFIVVGSLGLILRFVYGWELGLVQALPIGLGVIGIVLTDRHRRTFMYFVTDRRLITLSRGFTYKRRELPYSKITDLVLERGFLGSLFHYGTIIPITPSGLGLGEDTASVTIAAAQKVPRGPLIGGAVTGGRSVAIPRARGAYALHAIPHPEEVMRIISDLMGSSRGE